MTDEEYDYLFRDADPRWKAYYRTRREEYRKEHPLTNFEKWRDSLTPEASSWLIHYAEKGKKNCGLCPVRGCAQAKDTHCAKSFLRWANATAKEEK